MRIEFGMPVDCRDGPCGELGDLVIDPRRRTITHLVIEPHHHHHLARLVPVDDLDRRSSVAPLRLGCTVAEFMRYPTVEDRAFLRLGEWPPLDDCEWEVGVSTVLSYPYYTASGLSGPMSLAPGYDDPLLVAYDRIPAGEVEIRRGSSVEDVASVHVGNVDGFLMDDQECITHLVLERGHLWGHREVTLPISAVRRLRSDRLELGLSRKEIAALPSIRVGRHQTRSPK